MVIKSNGTAIAAVEKGKSEHDLRVELAAAYNILDYLNLGEGKHNFMERLMQLP